MAEEQDRSAAETADAKPPKYVGWPPRATGTMQKWDDDYESRVETAREAQIQEDAKWRALCKDINVRDECKCRACHRRVNPGAFTMLHKPHHHHIVFASAGGADTLENVVTLCSACHDDVHVRRRLRIEGNAQIALAFFRLNTESADFYLWRQESAVGVFVGHD